MSYIPPLPSGQNNSAGSAPVVVASDQSQIAVNEQHLILLGRIVKALEGASNIDSSQRMRITIDAINAAVTLAGVTTINNVNTVSNVLLNAGMGDEQFINIARDAYNTGIRSRLN